MQYGGILPAIRERWVKGDVPGHCDICVIGSGAELALLAKKLSDSDRSVVLLERIKQKKTGDRRITKATKRHMAPDGIHQA
jgi:choline dehydrogenase-like flavoprotein